MQSTNGALKIMAGSFVVSSALRCDVRERTPRCRVDSPLFERPTTDSPHASAATILLSATIISVIFVFCVNVFAEEGTSEGAASDSGSAAKANAGDSASQSDREWAKRKTKINILEARIKELTKQLQYLISVKNVGGAAVDEKGKPIDVLATIASSHKKLKEAVVEYHAEKSELKYRYPEEGARLDRRYVPIRLQTLEQIEKNSSLDGELIETKKKIDKKYSVFVGDELAMPPKPVFEPVESTLRNKKREEQNQSKRIRLSQ